MWLAGIVLALPCKTLRAQQSLSGNVYQVIEVVYKRPLTGLFWL